MHAGVNAAAHDLHVNVLWNGPQNETDYARQIEIVDSMITQQVSAIAISATDQDALVAPVERAIHAGIPVTVFDSAVNITDYVSFIATDNYAAGCTGARTLAGFIGAHGKVGMVMQRPGGTSTVLREQGLPPPSQRISADSDRGAAIRDGRSGTFACGGRRHLDGASRLGRDLCIERGSFAGQYSGD